MRDNTTYFEIELFPFLVTLAGFSCLLWLSYLLVADEILIKNSHRNKSTLKSCLKEGSGQTLNKSVRFSKSVEEKYAEALHDITSQKKLVKKQFNSIYSTLLESEDIKDHSNRIRHSILQLAVLLAEREIITRHQKNNKLYNSNDISDSLFENIGIITSHLIAIDLQIKKLMPVIETLPKHHPNHSTKTPFIKQRISDHVYHAVIDTWRKNEQVFLDSNIEQDTYNLTRDLIGLSHFEP
ncbi:MAG: hypothetical protein CL816_08355 [Coxiellaceae bacterium]|nr:hypothetical protein [Coxiellaceae bacterium]